MAGLGKGTVDQGSTNAHLPSVPSRVAALEASGTLATLYPVAFSSHLVPKLAEELCGGMCLSSSVACPFPGSLESLHACHHTVKPCLLGAFRGVRFGWRGWVHQVLPASALSTSLVGYINTSQHCQGDPASVAAASLPDEQR